MHYAADLGWPPGLDSPGITHREWCDMPGPCTA